MRSYRIVPVYLAGAGLLAFTAALARPAGAPPQPAPAVETPEAARCLDDAVNRLTMGKIEWLSCGIRQEVSLPGLRYTAEGRYLLAPGHRFRLEVGTRSGESTGTLVIVSDGVNRWQASRVGTGPWEKVTHLDVQQVLATLGVGGNAERLRAEFLEGPALSGIGPLLRTLRGRLIWVNVIPGRDAIELTGVWPPDAVREKAPADCPWPGGLPRLCRIVLDGTTRWPRRIEWWGPVQERGPDTLLALTEYRDPVINRPLAGDICAKAFAFSPGDAPITDRTGEIAADFATRLQSQGP
jgi:hypothetical protein